MEGCLKKQWRFVKDDALSDEETRYWVSTLKKILKIGLEFEFNLPGTAGHCPTEAKAEQGYDASTHCPCVKKEAYQCNQRCIHLEPCQEIPIRTRCAKHYSKACSSEEYPTCPEDCDRWEHLCLQEYCADFEAPCNHGCIYFQKDCDSCIESTMLQNNPHQIREKAIERFKPLSRFDKVNDSGVYAITTDDSLLGDSGIEVITTGRRFNYVAFHKMISEIIGFCRANGAFTNYRCGLHIHELTSWLENVSFKRAPEAEYTELERPMPAIIVANLHQLYRRFSVALVWMFSAGENEKHFTRWGKFRQSLMPYSPLAPSMFEVVARMQKEVESYRETQTGKYALVNYNWMRFSDDRQDLIKRFHVEFRGPDGNMSAAATTALVALHWALTIKAARLSRWGLIEAFDAESRNLHTTMLNSLLNNIGTFRTTYRVSNTEDFFVNGYDGLAREDSVRLIRMLKRELQECGDSYEVLLKLAQRPMTYMLKEGMTWDEIEEELRGHREELTELDGRIEMAIELGAIESAADDRDGFVKALYETMDHELELEQIDLSIGKLLSLGRIEWSDKLKSYIKL